MYLELCVLNIFGRNIYVRLKFSCVCSSHDLCACAHMHSLEGILVSVANFVLGGTLKLGNIKKLKWVLFILELQTGFL